MSTSCAATTGSTALDSESAGASFLSSAMNTSNSLSSSSAVLTLGRVGRPTFDLGVALALADRGARERIGPVLHESMTTCYSERETVAHTCLTVSHLHRFQGAQQGKVARSCSTMKQSIRQAYLQTAHVGVEQYQKRFPLVVLETKTQHIYQNHTPASHRPFASLPSYSFLARVASAGFSYVMIATPDERPLRSYFKSKR